MKNSTIVCPYKPKPTTSALPTNFMLIPDTKLRPKSGILSKPKPLTTNY
jgi:hypothetical protein